MSWFYSILCTECNHLFKLRVLWSFPLCYSTLTFNLRVTWQQVGMVTSTTTPRADSCATRSCTKSAQARVKFAGSLLDEPSTPCSNNQSWGKAIARDLHEWFAVDEHNYSHPGPYAVRTVAAVGMLLDYRVVQYHCHLFNSYITYRKSLQDDWQPVKQIKCWFSMLSGLVVVLFFILG